MLERGRHVSDAAYRSSEGPGWAYSKSVRLGCLRRGSVVCASTVHGWLARKATEVRPLDRDCGHTRWCAGRHDGLFLKLNRAMTRKKSQCRVFPCVASGDAGSRDAMRCSKQGQINFG